MPSSLTKDDIVNLANFAGRNDRSGYWSYIQNKGDDGYARMALSVTRNEGMAGYVANEFFKSKASEKNVIFSYEDYYDKVGVELMNQDLAARKAANLAGAPDGGLNLSVQVVWKNHHDTFFNASGGKLDITAWTAELALRDAMKRGAASGDYSEANKIWQDAKNGVALDGDRTFVQVLTDWVSQSSSAGSGEVLAWNKLSAVAAAKYIFTSIQGDAQAAFSYANIGRIDGWSYDNNYGWYRFEEISGVTAGKQVVFPTASEIEHLNAERAARIERFGTGVNLSDAGGEIKLHDGTIVKYTTLDDGNILVSRDGKDQDVMRLENADGKSLGEVVWDEFGKIKTVIDEFGKTINVGAAASSLGSSIGNAIAGDNFALQVGTSALLSTLLGNFGASLQKTTGGAAKTYVVGENGVSIIDQVINGTFADLDIQLRDNVRGQLESAFSSFVAGELAETLGLNGVARGAFTTVGSSVGQQMIRNITSAAADGGAIDLLNGFNTAEFARNLGNQLGSYFGSQLGQAIVTPKSNEAALFASAAASVMSTLLASVPVIGPFIGSFLGQTFGTMLGNSVFDRDDVAKTAILIDQNTGKLMHTVYEIVDGGNIEISNFMAQKAIDHIHDLIHKNDGHIYVPTSGFTSIVGYYINSDNSKVAWANKNIGPLDSNSTVAAIANAESEAIRGLDIIFQDPLYKRAFYASRENGIAQLGLDLQVAKDYRMYLDKYSIINAIIAADSKTEFAMGWLLTLQRAKELGLDRGSVNDFRNGFYANLETREDIQGPRGMAGGLAPERLAWVPGLDARDIAGKEMKTGDLILTSVDGLSSVRADNVFGPGEVVTLAGTNTTAAVDGSGINKPDASVIFISAGNGAKIVKGSANQGSIIVGGEGAQTLVGGKGNDWLRAGKNNKELLGGAGDDLLVAGGGSAIILDGGSGRNTYYLGPDDATVRISTLDSKGLETIITTLQGAFSGATSTINYSAKGGVSGLGMTKNSYFARIGADLHIQAVTPDYRDGVSKIVIENYFLSLNTIDAMVFSDGNLSSQQIWEKVGFRSLIKESTWNTADETKNNINIDVGDTQGDIYATVNTTTGDGSKKLFDIGIYDEGQMYTVAYDPSNDHDWTQWVSEYAASGPLAADRITLDVKDANGNAVVIARGNGGVVAGSAGDDVLRSASAGSTLIGDRGNDTLVGSGGADTLYGGSGDDRYTVGAGDQVFEFSGQGADVIESSVSYALIAGQEIETLRLLSSTGTVALNLTGNEFNNVLVGNAGANVLIGGAGNDTLDGAGGNDDLRGGTGNDIYLVDATGDVVRENASEGTDEVRTNLDAYTLAATLENLSYIGTGAFTGTGNGLNNVITGGSGADSLTGNAGNDTLQGGDGNDVMQGGTGDDLYAVNDAGDRVIEADGQGTDVIVATVSYEIGTGQEIERIQLARSTGTQALNLSGNELNNVLWGNGGNNTLNGRGGADQMDGNAGNDTYGVDNAGDIVVEATNEGTDTIIAGNTHYTLAAGVSVEVMRFANSVTGDYDLTGNELNNEITGTVGSNVLIGNGGSDILRGREGDDTYSVDSTGDQVLEAVGQGNDTVVALVSYKLQAGQEIETLQLASATAGASLNLEGNEFANSLSGNSGANRLIGGGGSDTLLGKGGADTFVFNAALGANNLDRIVDFVGGEDKILLDNSVMATLSAGTLAASAFKNLSQSAADADDRILYNQSTGDLWYDADGSGSTAGVRIAILNNKAALNYQDILVV